MTHTRLVVWAVEVARQAHKGQVDKAGVDYILHPLRVMAAMRTDEERMVAVLHDVIEDTPISLNDLRDEGFPEAVVEAVDAISRRPGEVYRAYIDRCAQNPLARRVKVEDVLDNLWRLGNLAAEAERKGLTGRYLTTLLRLRTQESWIPRWPPKDGA